MHSIWLASNKTRPHKEQVADHRLEVVVSHLLSTSKIANLPDKMIRSRGRAEGWIYVTMHRAVISPTTGTESPIPNPQPMPLLFGDYGSTNAGRQN